GTAAVALGPDGALAAMVGGDGVVRIVDVASRNVAGLLAPSHASIGLAAFSPSGDSVLTLARGEPHATLWRAGRWRPGWPGTLPGHVYLDPYPGGVAFAPDGATAVLSPGWGVYLLDVATGSLLGSHEPDDFYYAVLNVAFGWNGRRVAVAEAT